jgi:hypothetical protein
VFGTYSGGSTGTLLQGGTSTDYITRVGGKLRQTIATNGDISFYEDTGTTAKFFWDASAESLGIGTSSPDMGLHVLGGEVLFEGTGNSKLQIKAGNTSSSFIEFGDAQDGNVGRLLYSHGDNSMQFTVNASEAMRIDSSGNVGIGTNNNPSAPLHVKSSTGNAISLLEHTSPTVGTGQVGRFVSSTSNITDVIDSNGYYRIGSSTNPTTGAGFAERMRIDSSGNVGIGTSSPDSDLHVFDSDGDANVTIESTSSNGDARLNLYASSAGVSQIRFGNEADTNTGLLTYTHSDESMSFRTNDQERMRIDSSGNVGIGTSSIDNKINIQESALAGRSASNGNTSMTLEHATDTGIQFFSAGQTQLRFGDASSTGAGSIIYEHATDRLRFATGSTERMRIDSSGNLLVGQTTETANAGKLQISGRNGHHCATFKNGNNGGYGLVFRRTDNTAVGTITWNGSSVSYNTSSDYRLKENVVDLTGASARVNQLDVKRFNFIADETNTIVDGFLAHEVADVVPEAVSGTKDAMKDEEYEVTPAVEATYDEDGNELTAAVEAVMGTRSVPDYQGIDQSKLVPLLTAALQEALTEIASLKTRVETLEG